MSQETAKIELRVRAEVDIETLTQGWSEGEVALLRAGSEEASGELESALIARALERPDDCETDDFKVSLKAVTPDAT